MAGNNSIQILRCKDGITSSISNETLLPGQLFYNQQKNYLTVGQITDDDSYSSISVKPITVKELQGYFDDGENSISSVTTAKYSIAPLYSMSENYLRIYSSGNLNLSSDSNTNISSFSNLGISANTNMELSAYAIDISAINGLSLSAETITLTNTTQCCLSGTETNIISMYTNIESKDVSISADDIFTIQGNNTLGISATNGILMTSPTGGVSLQSGNSENISLNPSLRVQVNGPMQLGDSQHTGYAFSSFNPAYFYSNVQMQGDSSTCYSTPAISSSSYDIIRGQDLYTEQQARISQDNTLSSKISTNTTNISDLSTKLSSHTSNTSNPHSVTLTQVGGNKITLNGSAQSAGATVSFYAPTDSGYNSYGYTGVCVASGYTPYWKYIHCNLAFMNITYKIGGTSYTRKGIFPVLGAPGSYSGTNVQSSLQLSNIGNIGMMYMGSDADQPCFAVLSKSGNYGYIEIYRYSGSVDAVTISSVSLIDSNTVFALLD